MKAYLSFFFCLLFVLPLLARQEDRYSSASLGMIKQRANNLTIPKPSEIVIEEFFNYHHHDLPLPQNNENVKMDMRWGNTNISPQQPETILQIGFTTPKTSKFIDETPLNICLVIDRSGSMGGDRIENARQSALTLVSKLRPQDEVSIVIFDDQVDILLEHEKASNQQKIKQIIQSIEVRGSTDLNSGLKQGYELIAQKYNEKGTNKVLLLTDVLTNTGEVDVEAIIKNTKNYSWNHQIGITIVAIGVEVNDALARQITQSGKHSFHYVNDAEDIKKIFVDEVESIFSVIAKEVKLTIDYDQNLELLDFYGYMPAYRQNTISLGLNNMNAGLTQVVLMKFKSKNPNISSKAIAKLEYYDVEKRKIFTDIQQIEIGSGIKDELLANYEVKKCISIAEMAISLKKMATMLNQKILSQHDRQQAKDLLDIQIGEIKKRYQSEMDQDVKRVLSMLENYTQALYVRK